MTETTQKQIQKIEELFTLTEDSSGWFDIEPRKHVEDNSIMHEGKEYCITLKPYIVNEPPNFSLSMNWNGGEKFKSQYLKCKVLEIRGKMIKINGTDDDMNVYSEMWVPKAGIDEFEVIKN